MILFWKNLLFTVLVPGTVAVYVPLSIASDLPAARGPIAAALRAAALAPFAVGVCVYAWCVWDFAVFGRGTPAPIDAPKRLVARGLYRTVRNPMYVGVLAVILGFSLHFGSLPLLAYAGAVGLAFHLFVVAYEEPALRRSFGVDYERYCAEVGRWIPRIRARDRERDDPD